MVKFFFLFSLLTSSIWAFDLTCQRSDLSLSNGSWETSPDFLTLNFTGSRAKTVFDGIGSPGSQFFSVIMRHEWCRSLESAILCESPLSALVEVETSETETGPKTKIPLRYFITILDYREDGWAFLKVRGQKMDSNPPITFHTEFPVGSCSVVP